MDGNLNTKKFLELIEYVDQIPLDVYRKMWFQLDSLLETRSRAYLENNGSGGIGPRRWPARFQDLTPLHFFCEGM